MCQLVDTIGRHRQETPLITGMFLWIDDSQQIIVEHEVLDEV